MLGKFNNMLTGAKDKALSVGVQKVINHKIEEFGELLKFDLNSGAKTMELEVMLDGEREALHVKVNNYTLIQEGEKHFLVATDIVTSRVWINKVASQYLSGQKFEIPQEYAKMLKIVV